MCHPWVSASASRYAHAQQQSKSSPSLLEMQVEVFRICKLHAPQLFWHHFPPLTDLQNFFVEITNSDNTQSAPPRVVKNRENKRKKRKIQAEIALDMQEDSEMVTNDANNDSMEVAMANCKIDS
jgi:hypothetical protein